MRAKTKKWFSPLFVLTLAVAGIFGVSAAVVDKQAEETPVVEKADAATTSTRLYLKPNGNWKQDSARFAIWRFNGSPLPDTWLDMNADPDNSGYYYVDYSDLDGYSGIIFVRMNPEASDSWESGHKWNQTKNLTKPTNDNILFDISGRDEWNDFNSVDWSSLTFQVSFDMQNHGSQVSSQNIVPGNKVSKPSNPTATGYTFGGWYTDGACTSSWDFTNDVVYKARTLYAKWTVNTYTITYKDQGGSAFSGTTSSPTSYTYGEGATLLSATKTNYAFNHFNW